MNYRNYTALLAVLMTTSLYGTIEGAAVGSEEPVQLKDVIVTATKTEEEVKTVPQAVEVWTRDDLQRMGAANVRSALQLANNVNLARAGMTGNAVMIRGMSTNHSLILVDGKRYAGEDTDVTTNVYALERLDLSDIDRIEIVRGPSSSLYGSDAMGGVINIITKVPDKAGGTAGVVTGTENTASYVNVDFGKHHGWSTSFDARWDRLRPFNRYTYSSTVSGRGTRTVTEGYDRALYGMRRMYHLASVYDFENSNRNKLRFDLEYHDDDLKSEFAPAWYAMGPMKLPTSQDKREFYHEQERAASVEYTGKTGRNDYMFRTYYNQLKKNSFLYNDRPRFPGMMENILGGMYPKEDMDRATYSTWVTEARNTMYVGDHHNLTFGGEYRKLKYEGTRLSGSSVGLDKDVAGHEVNSYAGYIEDLWQVNDRLLLVPSVRFEHNSQFGSQTTPKIGLTYNLNENWRFKSNYGQGYKAPSISELYMEMHRAMGATTVNVYGNPDLEPEKSTSYDFSLEYDKDRNFGKLTYFHNKVTNLIESAPIGYMTYQYINIAKADINGVEAELGHRLNDHWTVKVTHNYLDATNGTTGERLNYRARHTTTLQLLYDDHKEKGFSAVLWDQFSNDYRFDGQDYTYNTLNFSFRKKLSGGFAVYGGVDDIFDKKVDDIYVDGRMWRLGAEWKW